MGLAVAKLESGHGRVGNLLFGFLCKSIVFDKKEQIALSLFVKERIALVALFKRVIRAIALVAFKKRVIRSIFFLKQSQKV